MDERERHARGLKVRAEVLGEEHVASRRASAGAFDRDFQDLLTRYAWGEIWTRPGLTRRERSLLTLAMLLARGQWEEFALHLEGARRNGASLEDIRELLLQAAIYCGIPAANHAFAVARGIFAAELGRADGDAGLSGAS